jgi:hypothetical protein
MMANSYRGARPTECRINGLDFTAYVNSIDVDVPMETVWPSNGLQFYVPRGYANVTIRMSVPLDQWNRASGESAPQQSQLDNKTIFLGPGGDDGISE